MKNKRKRKATTDDSVGGKRTQIQAARAGAITAEMRKVAESEGLEPEFVRDEVAAGRMVILHSRAHAQATPVAIGGGSRTKVNANIGTSTDADDTAAEMRKLAAAINAGADAVMDLSTGGDLDAMRRAVLERSTVPVGTVPIYQTVKEAADAGEDVSRFSAEALFEEIEKHAADGVSFVTVHCGVNRASLDKLASQGRILGIVSRGGAFLAHYIRKTGRENPLYERFDRLLDIAERFDLTLSLGDGLRPGCLADATDRAQVEELSILGELRRRALERGVQVMIEGPGHIPLHEVELNIRLQKALTGDAPFYVLGPVVTDIAPGFDHVTSAIGGALAAYFGADFLCYVTPSEHIRLPDERDVVEGVIAARIAAHAADVARGRARAAERDRAMAEARAALDWQAQENLSILPSRFRFLRSSSPPKESKVCTMCGPFCPVRLMLHHDE